MSGLQDDGDEGGKMCSKVVEEEVIGRLLNDC